MVQKQAALSGGIGSDAFADDDPLAELARIVGFEAPSRHKPEAPVAVEPVFDLEDELLREFETYDAPAPTLGRGVATREIFEAPEPAREQPEQRDEPSLPASDDFAEPVEISVEAEVPELSVEPDAGEAEGEPQSSSQDWYAQDVASDLIGELELAIADIPEVEVQAPAPAPATPQTPARLSLPLANFSAGAPPVDLDAEPELPQSAFDAGPGGRADEAADADAEDWFFPGDAVAEEEVRTAQSQNRNHSVIGSDFDNLASEVQDFRAPGAVEARSEARSEPDFSFSFADELAASEDIYSDAPVTEPLGAARDVVDEPQTVAADSYDPFADGEFDLQLDELELNLDLSDIEPVSEQSAPIVESVPMPQPVAVQQPMAARVVTPVPQPIAAPVAQPVAPQVTAAPAPVEMHLPFDPTQIAEQEEHPSSMPAMDVPEMPAPEAFEKPSYRPDYDIDIDSELASLFESAGEATPVAAAAVAARSATASAAAEAQKPAAAAPAAANEFDVFERALEEDFLRTLETPRENIPSKPNKVMIQHDSMPATVDGGGRRWLLAASVAAVAIAGIGGLYMWMSGPGADILVSGEPPVIVADKDPIKIVPEDKGGASVPNQDKAVYDRVEGAAVEEPKQESLISASEEPVDVVQKTLLPETLPLEGENEVDVTPTPVGETEDPRLLPGEAPTEQAATPDAAEPVSITPRKVRTMIVKPDGTLVTQEVPVAEPAAPAEPAVTAPAPLVQAPQAVATASAPQSAEAAAEAVAAPVAAPVAEVEAPAAQPEVAPAEPAAKAPVPVTRPADQPVNVVGTVTDQGNVRTPDSQAVADTQSAAAEPAPVAVPPGGYLVQIASLPSEAEAQKSYKNLSTKFASVIGGRGVDIQKAEIAGKGTYYRVRIPAGSKADAVALCERYRQAGGTCLVAK